MRFYGGTAVSWLAETPLGIVQACLTQIARLQAQESLLAVNRIAVALGGEGTRQVAAAWQRDAGRTPLAPATLPSPQRLGTMGIGVRRVPITSPSAETPA